MSVSAHRTNAEAVGAQAAARSAWDVMLTDAALDEGGMGRFIKPTVAAKVAFALARRPGRVAGRARELGGGVGRGGFGRSQLAPAKGDKRFADPAWQGN